MNDIDLRYSVGPLLYSPALNAKIASFILSSQFGTDYSVALCLEDTIADSAVGQALEQLEKTFAMLHIAATTDKVTLPKIFVRVRDPEQIRTVYRKISVFSDVFSGFIFPKYSLANADDYNGEFSQMLSESTKQLYMMPILESTDIVDYASRQSVLIRLKRKIDSVKDHVLNIRVGGNDFCNVFGVRRHIDETIYDILPVSQLLCDILTVFSRDYVVSAPVWEYYASENDEWITGLKRELKHDILNGFVGKTVIHPNQIPVVLNSLKVDRKDYDDAMQILNWGDENQTLVVGSVNSTRMNEMKTHKHWAERIVATAKIYGIQK